MREHILVHPYSSVIFTPLGQGWTTQLVSQACGWWSVGCPRNHVFILRMCIRCIMSNQTAPWTIHGLAKWQVYLSLEKKFSSSFITNTLHYKYSVKITLGIHVQWLGLFIAVQRPEQIQLLHAGYSTWTACEVMCLLYSCRIHIQWQASCCSLLYYSLPWLHLTLLDALQFTWKRKNTFFICHQL